MSELEELNKYLYPVLGKLVLEYSLSPSYEVEKKYDGVMRMLMNRTMKIYRIIDDLFSIKHKGKYTKIHDPCARYRMANKYGDIYDGNQTSCVIIRRYKYKRSTGRHLTWRIETINTHCYADARDLCEQKTHIDMKHRYLAEKYPMEDFAFINRLLN